MAEVPSDVQWPPGDVIDFDDILEALLDLKEQHFPEHTARDLADPYVQILVLIASLQQHSFGRMNHALLQLSPKTATSRKALVSMLDIVNRRLLTYVPSRGPLLARVKNISAIPAGSTIVEEGLRIAPPDSIDPIYTVDSTTSKPTTFGSIAFHWDKSADTETQLGPVNGPFSSFTMDVGDALVIAMETLVFSGLDISFTTPLVGGGAVSWEFYTDQAGTPNSVVNLGSTLRMDLSTYLFDGEGTSTLPIGLSVTVTHVPSSTSEVVEVSNFGGDPVVVTSFLSQSSPSLSAQDYTVLSNWRPIRSIDDQTSELSQDSADGVTWPILKLFEDSSDARWVKSEDGLYRIRARRTTGSLPRTLEPDTITFPTSVDGIDVYVSTDITQGRRRELTIGQTDGTNFQFMSVQTQPIEEPVANPKISMSVGTDTDWTIVDDFSNSDSTSKNAVFKEDPDDGFGILFGDGSVGKKPPQGEAVKITFRTDSIQPGDLAALSEVRAIGGIGLTDQFTIWKGTTGYAPPEASDRPSALRFREAVLPQLSLRADSAITRDEIVRAMTGGAPNRATFTTSDGKKPFSRALFTLEGAGTRQYRVVVVGQETQTDGSVDTADLAEAETYLNGTQIGVEIIGGMGPNNTQAIVDAFVPRLLTPTVTITIPNTAGVRAQADQIVRQFFRPHSRDEDENFRWSFGGKVPMALLFGLLWDGIPGRTFIEISTTDGVTTYTTGSSVDLLTFELPVLDSSYDAQTNIVLVEG